jgi:hypothetical protein
MMVPFGYNKKEETAKAAHFFQNWLMFGGEEGGGWKDSTQHNLL